LFAARINTSSANSTRFNEVYNPMGWTRPFFNFTYPSNATDITEYYSREKWDKSEECYASYNAYNFYISSLYRDSRYYTHQTYTETYVSRYSIGEGAVYTLPSEKIPRYCFKESPTVFSTSTFSMERVRTIPAIPLTLPEQPSCDLVSPWCDALYNHNRQKGLLDFGPAKENKALYDLALGIQRFGSDCGLKMSRGDECQIKIEDEVILIYWPNNGISSEACDEHKGRFGVTKRIDESARLPSPVVTDQIVFQGPDLYKTGHGTDIYGKMFGSDRYKFTLIIPGSTYTLTKPADAFTLTGNFTFVYPTVYLAHRFITASVTPPSWDSKWKEEFSFPSQVQTPGIVALNPSDVYTLQPKKLHFTGDDYIRLVASGSFTYEPRVEWLDGNTWIPKPMSAILPIKYDNLIDPVPASLYYDARVNFCWGLNTQNLCATITDGSHRPQLAFKQNVWGSIMTSLGAWDCGMPIVVDPPIALSPVYSLEHPVLPSSVSIQLVQSTNSMAALAAAQQPSAQPGIGVEQTLPGPTPLPESYRGPSNDQHTAVPNLRPEWEGDNQIQNPTRTIDLGPHKVFLVREPTSELIVYIGSSTLRQGQAVTVDGHTVSIANTAVLLDKSVVLAYGRPTASPNDALASHGVGSKVSTQQLDHAARSRRPNTESIDTSEVDKVKDRASKELGKDPGSGDYSNLGTSNGALATDSAFLESVGSFSTGVVSAYHKTGSHSSSKPSLNLPFIQATITGALLVLQLM
jgi:hypothetical protein